MILNVYMDMTDSVCNYIYQAAFPFDVTDEEVFKKAIALLNGEYDDKADPEKDKVWDMLEQLLHEANKFLIATVPQDFPKDAANVVDGLIQWYSDEEFLTSPEGKKFSQLVYDLNKCRGILKRTNMSSDKYGKNERKVARAHSAILQYNYDDKSEDILFDCEAAFVKEWEEEKAASGEGKQTDLAEVKLMTKSYIRNYKVEVLDDFGTAGHPVAEMVFAPNPENPQFQYPTPSQEVIDAWLAENKPILYLLDPADFEKWVAHIDTRIDTASSVEEIYRGIIRPNWVDSWLGFVKEKLSFADRLLAAAVEREHREWFKAEWERKFGNKRF